MRRRTLENRIFVVVSILLILFQVGLYMKVCKFPNFLDMNMIFLYIALAMPFIIRKIERKSKKLAGILFTIYLLYFILTLGFIVAFLNQSPSGLCLEKYIFSLYFTARSITECGLPVFLPIVMRIGRNKSSFIFIPDFFSVK